MPNGKYPTGNMLLSLAGASISKILLVFFHLGLACYLSHTFFAHHWSFLFPTVIHHWESYRTGFTTKLKTMNNAVWSGDGQFDSLGHAARYRFYTMLCTAIMKVVHFEVVQV